MFAPLGSVHSLEQVQCLCIGSGRFLRAVLVPALRAANMEVMVVQPQGMSFVNAILSANPCDGEYEVDTVLENGRISTERVRIAAVGTINSNEHRAQLLDKCRTELSNVTIVGVGVTEAGVTENSPVMNDLAAVLHAFQQGNPAHALSVINTDNIPNNGDKIREFVAGCTYTASLPSEAESAYLKYLADFVVFHTTMVDRITSGRQNNPLVPRAEPLPLKALVIEDLNHVLPKCIGGGLPGVVLRHNPGEIEADHKLKLRIANATHTAVVYAMALSRVHDTSELHRRPEFMQLLDKLMAYDISVIGKELDAFEAEAVYQDWRRRLEHPHFGLSTFFISQNATQKLGIRLMPTVIAVLDEGMQPSHAMAFAVASLLRYITPMGEQVHASEHMFRGKLDSVDASLSSCESVDIEYATGLVYNLMDGNYDFKDGDGSVCRMLLRHPRIAELSRSAIASDEGGVSGDELTDLIAAVLELYDGWRYEVTALPTHAAHFVHEVALFYARMINGEPALHLLKEVVEATEHRAPLSSHFLASVKSTTKLATREEAINAVRKAVLHVQAIDLHTHLFPPSHGDLMKWGIDDLLTYHYLVAEFFESAPATLITIEQFYALPTSAQADMIWEHLFLCRTPLSEATMGVCTTLSELGLGEELQRRDLTAIREWFADQEPDEHVETVFKLAKLKYCVMTNVPFDQTEAQHWRPHKKAYSERFRSALRVDPLLKNDWSTVKAALESAQYPVSPGGAIQYLLDWVETMRPEYLMASTPHDFQLRNFRNHGEQKRDDSPYSPDLLEDVLVPVAMKCNLPLVLKLEAHRGVNPALRTAGDGIQMMDPDVLAELCRRYPKVKFLTTFLSRANQHNVCVLANKFPNLHLYGCWWYCNNPSIIREITAMRLELLGTAFTAQHSDARVLDQLVYKWKHSRRIIADVLAEQYSRLYDAGWAVSHAEIEREVYRLFGGAYEEFMQKQL